MNSYQCNFHSLRTIILLDILLGGVIMPSSSPWQPTSYSPALRKSHPHRYASRAVIIRLIMTFIAVWLLTIPYLQVIGGLILLPIAVKLPRPGRTPRRGQGLG